MATNPNASPDLFKKQLEETRPQRVQDEVKKLEDLSGAPKTPKAGGELPITQLSPSIENLLTSAGKVRSTKDVMGLRSQATQELLKAQQAEGAAQQQVALDQARLKGEYATKEAQAYRKIDDERQRRMAQAQIPDFNPTQDNLLTLGTMASLIAVVGAVVGQQGGLSGIGAVNAMAGMMQGYQAGRKDVFEREKVKFDKDMARLKAEQEKIMKEFEAAYKRIPYDMAEARADMETALVKANSPLLKAIYDKQGAEAVLKILNESAADIRHLDTMRNKVGLTAGKGFLKPGADVGKGYMSINVLSNDLKAIEQDLQNPDLQKQIAEYRIQAFLTEEGKVLDQLLGTQLPPELASFLTKVRDIRNNYYLDISGKAVTGGEALRNYGTVPQPGDTPERMQNKIQGLQNRVNQKIQQYQFLYGLPPVPENVASAGTRNALTPGQNYQTEESMPVITSKEQYEALPSGSEYYEMDSTGKKTKFRKP